MVKTLRPDYGSETILPEPVSGTDRSVLWSGTGTTGRPLGMTVPTPTLSLSGVCETYTRTRERTYTRSHRPGLAEPHDQHRNRCVVHGPTKTRKTTTQVYTLTNSIGQVIRTDVDRSIRTHTYIHVHGTQTYLVPSDTHVRTRGPRPHTDTHDTDTKTQTHYTPRRVSPGH